MKKFLIYNSGILSSMQLFEKWLISILLSLFLLTACGESQPSDSKTFDWELRGHWVSSDYSVYGGELLIDYNRIEIWGYLENQTPENGDDTRRPFRDFTKAAPLTGYSQNDSIFIRDAGVWQEGIPYIYYSEDYGKIAFLRFTFGDRVEILRRVEE